MSSAIPQPVLEVLSAADVEGSILRLTGQLDRKLYESTNKVLEALGGKWSRRDRGHVFPGDATALVEDAILTGSYVRPQDNGYFPTPLPVLRRLMELAAIEDRPGIRLLEPSAGSGNIAGALLVAAPACHLQCVEITPRLADALKDRGFTVWCGDFLDFSRPPEEHYDWIVMNPPFARQQDIAHVTHAWELLKPGGRLVSVMASGVTFRQDAKAFAFRDVLIGHFGRWEANPEGSFKDSETMVNTVTVVLDKP